jgi:hypothetical protein
MRGVGVGLVEVDVVGVEQEERAREEVEVDPLVARATFGAAMLPMMAAQTGIDPAIATDISTGLTSLLQNSGTLTISLNPQTPLSASTFADIEDPSIITKDMLGLTVTHEE